MCCGARISVDSSSACGCVAVRVVVVCVGCADVERNEEAAILYIFFWLAGSECVLARASVRVGWVSVCVCCVRSVCKM